MPVCIGGKQPDTRGVVGDAGAMHPNCCWGQALQLTPRAEAGRKRRLGKGVETTWFADARAFLLPPGYPRKPSRLSGGAGWYLRTSGRGGEKEC